MSAPATRKETYSGNSGAGAGQSEQFLPNMPVTAV